MVISLARRCWTTRTLPSWIRARGRLPGDTRAPLTPRCYPRSVSATTAKSICCSTDAPLFTVQDYLGLHPAPSESHMGSRIMRKLSASAGGSSTRTSGSHNANSFSGSVCSSHVSSGSRGTEDEDLEHAIRLSLQQQHVVEENSKCSTEADPADPVTAGISTSSILPGFAVSDVRFWSNVTQSCGLCSQHYHSPSTCRTVLR